MFDIKNESDNNSVRIIFPDNLPISSEIETIRTLINNNQLVIICGETGSGKTTQLPKLLLQMGFATNDKIIGHTQPRKVAAKSLAHRIAYELNNEDLVGYKIRFQNKTKATTAIKLMTDGILLQEIQKDRLLWQYSALIIDEAHERSLNIDFILGYLKTILPKRKDLKIIITSATIENEKFSKFFNQAPIINVAGLTYPVDIIYQPIGKIDKCDEEDNTNNSKKTNDDYDFNFTVYKAISSCLNIELGNVLVFLPGEREIKDVIFYLKKTELSHYQILPLFSRQNENEQNLIFKEDNFVKIIVTTNVAETSLTIHGVKYVIDSGLARVNRYNQRYKIEQLLVEKISKASAKQRAGRAGRTSHGMCVRLYAEEDFNTRKPFSDPEILRSNLANVILKLITFRLGDPYQFPFLDRPQDKTINDGYKNLFILKAITEDSKHVTHVGRLLAQIPIDVNLARMLIASALEFNVLHETLIIVSFLAISDPREYPFEYQNLAQERHKLWLNKESEFMTIINIWIWYMHKLHHKKSKNKFLEDCRYQFISALRLRQWHELYGQLKEIMHNLGYKENPLSLDDNFNNLHNVAIANTNNTMGETHRKAIKNEGSLIEDTLSKRILSKDTLSKGTYNYQSIHMALLTGLLNNVGQKSLEEPFYNGTNGKKFYLHPASQINATSWICAANIIETTKLYARICAKIDPNWLNTIAKHIIKYNYANERYSQDQGAVVVSQLHLLFGLNIFTKQVPFSNINPDLARELFIKHALVNYEVKKKYHFILHNQQVINTLEELEHKVRISLLAIDDELYNYYDNHLPHNICDLRTLEYWLKDKNNEAKLMIPEEDFIDLFLKENNHLVLYPNSLISGSEKIELQYVFN
ncbi:MAG: DUF3418 domain-containing protein, partial [Bacteroidia bacterium]